MRLPLTVLSVCLSFASLQANSIEVALPPGTGAINVRSDGGARGDGKTDDTQALKAILEAGKGSPHPKWGAAREIYFPNGVYLISEPLLIGDKKKAVVGQSRDGVILRLKDKAAAFQNPEKPMALLSATSSYPGWHFAQNFGQRLHNLTLEIGADNPGAIGLNYHTNNMGDIGNLRIVSRDAQRRGAIGLLLGGGTGPGLVRSVEIQGFDIGCLYPGDLHSMVLSDLRLSEQRVVGFENRGNTVSIQRLISRNRVPALRSTGGHLALTHGEFLGGAREEAAVRFEKAHLFLRNVQTQGYGQAIVGPDTRLAGGVVDQFVWPKVWTLFSGPEKSINLPVEEPPLAQLGTPTTWHVVQPDQGDLTKPLQKAIDAGHEYILVAAQAGEIRDTIHVRNKVRIIRGVPSTYRTSGFKDGDRLLSYQPLKIEKGQNKRPVWRIEDGSSPVVLLQWLGDNYGDASWGVEHASRRTLICWAAGGSYRNSVTGGKAFFLDAGPQPGSVLRGPQQVWAWNTNIESYVDDPNILNDGATLWILGLKSEKDRTLITTRNGGSTEVIGGLLFKNRERIGPAPAFINEGGRLSLSYRVTRMPYQTHVLEKRGDETRELRHSEVGWLMPLYNSIPSR